MEVYALSNIYYKLLIVLYINKLINTMLFFYVIFNVIINKLLTQYYLFMLSLM
jgi:hypothetical protein